MLLLFVICLMRNSSVFLSNFPFIQSLHPPSLSHWDFYPLLLSTNFFFRNERHSQFSPLTLHHMLHFLCQKQTFWITIQSFPSLTLFVIYNSSSTSPLKKHMSTPNSIRYWLYDLQLFSLHSEISIPSFEKIGIMLLTLSLELFLISYKSAYCF